MNDIKYKDIFQEYKIRDHRQKLFRTSCSATIHLAVRLSVVDMAVGVAVSIVLGAVGVICTVDLKHTVTATA